MTNTATIDVGTAVTKPTVTTRLQLGVVMARHDSVVVVRWNNGDVETTDAHMLEPATTTFERDSRYWTEKKP